MSLKVKLSLVLVWSSLLLGLICSATDELVKVDGGWYVVCSERSCEDLNFKWPVLPGQMALIVTSKDGDHFTSKHGSWLLEEATYDEQATRLNDSAFIKLSLSPLEEFQTILGWGGALTDATGVNFASLSDKMAGRLMDSYFGPGGLNLNLARVPIGGTDFSTHAYTYDDSATPDPELKHWALDEADRKLKIPMIKRALEREPELKLFASPWSAPAWMKTSRSLVRGHLKPTGTIYSAYRDYYLRFFDAYSSEGIHFWGATVQNEPLSSFLPTYYFNSMHYTNFEMTRFISNYLGPELERRGMTKDKFKLMIGDDSLGLINYQVGAILKNQKAAKYVSGVAFHWYAHKFFPYSLASNLYNKHKSQIDFMLMTEACTGWMKPQGPQLGSWAHGAEYAGDIVNDLLNQASGWVDWNLALDLKGGPTYVHNYVDSPILVDATKDSFYRQPMYYVRAHFSLHRPGSVRVGYKLPVPVETLAHLQVVSTLDKSSHHLVVNVFNNSPAHQPIELHVEGMPQLRRKLIFKPDSLTSIVMKL